MILGTIDGDSTTEILGFIKHIEKDRKYSVIGRSQMKPSPRDDKRSRVYLDIVKKSETVDIKPRYSKKHNDKAYRNLNCKSLMKPSF